MVKVICLSNGGVTLLDDCDYELARGRTWRNNWRPNNPLAYAVCSGTIEGRRGHHITLHRLILGLHRGDGIQVDHINHDTLDNRRSNLRLATVAQNQANRLHVVRSTPGFRGVVWHTRGRKWMAQIKGDNRTLYLGLFADAADAARAYDRKAREIWGEFASPNFPEVTA